MTPEFIVGFARQAIEVTLIIALPMLGIGMVVGIFVSVIQAATQIQEMTLTMVPNNYSYFPRTDYCFSMDNGQNDGLY